MSRAKKLWIQNAVEHPGSLRKKLHARPGHNIPKAKLDKALHSKNLTLRKEANLAETLGKMRRRKHSRD